MLGVRHRQGPTLSPQITMPPGVGHDMHLACVAPASHRLHGLLAADRKLLACCRQERALEPYLHWGDAQPRLHQGCARVQLGKPEEHDGQEEEDGGREAGLEVEAQDEIWHPTGRSINSVVVVGSTYAGWWRQAVWLS